MARKKQVEIRSDGTTPTEVTTRNKNLGTDIEVTVDFTVPLTIPEMIDVFGSQEKFIYAAQVDIFRRSKMNAARTALRDAEFEQDWEALALSTGEDWAPGKRSKGARPVVSESALEKMSEEEKMELFRKYFTLTK